MFKWFLSLFKKVERPCQCGHMRCYHNYGKMSCHFMDDTSYIHACKCTTYIPGDATIETDEVKELERIARLR